MNKSHKVRASLFQEISLRYSFVLLVCHRSPDFWSSPLASQYLILSRRHLTVVKLPSMNHLLRICQVTPCSPQPEETWEHTAVCILGKCFNHEHLAQTGAISHPGSAAGRTYEKMKDTAACAWMGGSGTLSFGKNSFLFLLDMLEWAGGEHLSPCLW